MNGLPLGRALTTVNDQLFPGLLGIGDWVAGDGAPLNFEVHGARLGYQPQRVRFTRTDADTGASAAATTTFVQLDPAVDLVPIQVVVLYSNDYPLPESRLAAQLALWDQVALSTSYTTSNLGPFRRYTTRTLTPTPQRVDVPAGVQFLGRISPIAYPGTYAFQNSLTPDAQWRDCGVQFRLVNYVEILVTNKTTAPRRASVDIPSNHPDFWPISADFGSPCVAAGNIADASPLVDTSIPTLIFMRDPTFPGEPSDALYVGNHACVSFTPSAGAARGPNVIAHELGHLALLPDNNAGHMMVSGGAGFAPPTAQECVW